MARHLRLAFTIVHLTGAVERNASSPALSAVAEPRATLESRRAVQAVTVPGLVVSAAMAFHATSEIHTAVVGSGVPCTRVAEEILVLTRAVQDQ